MDSYAPPTHPRSRRNTSGAPYARREYVALRNSARREYVGLRNSARREYVALRARASKIRRTRTAAPKCVAAGYGRPTTVALRNRPAPGRGCAARQALNGGRLAPPRFRCRARSRPCTRPDRPPLKTRSARACTKRHAAPFRASVAWLCPPERRPYRTARGHRRADTTTTTTALHSAQSSAAAIAPFRSVRLFCVCVRRVEVYNA